VAAIQIRCINKLDRNSQHEGITHVGDGMTKWPRAYVVAKIEAKENNYYTLVNGNRADVGVVTPTHGEKYLRTYADGKWNDNLLALMECR
jgi:hypothetical protein